MFLAVRRTGNGRLIHKLQSSGSAINRHQEKLINFAAATIVEVSLQTEVKKIVAIHRQGCQSGAFLLVTFPSLTTNSRPPDQTSILPMPRAFTKPGVAVLAALVQALSVTPSPPCLSLSVLGYGDPGFEFKATSGDLPSRTDTV